MNLEIKPEIAGIKRESDIVPITVRKSGQAFREYSALPQSGREVVVEAIKEALIPLVDKIAEMELLETGMGIARDKAEKLMLAINKTSGLEGLTPWGSAGGDGVRVLEYCAYGIICVALPATNQCATLISNIIGMLSAGNSVIITPHPRCFRVSGFAVSCINEAINSASGICNLVSVLPQPSMQLTAQLMNHPDVSMVVATGGGKIIKQALASSKRVIIAGPANPVAMVDETANLAHAAKCIADGASFDNNISCVSEKNIVVVSSAADEFIEQLKAHGVYFVREPNEMLKLTKAAINNSFLMNRSLAGRSAGEILNAAGIDCGSYVRLIVAETARTHPFVTNEMLMPLVPLVRVSSFGQLIETAVFIEQGNRHTAAIHSQSVARLSKAAQVMQTSVFVRNGSSLSALGIDGGACAGFTIANITGEGVITAKDFARKRCCSLKTGL